MPITQTCPTCGGTGVQTLGMSFEEAVTLAQRIGTAGNLFEVRAIESRRFGPSGAYAWIVTAGHLPSGGTTVTFKSPDFYESQDWLIWNPLGRAEG